MCLCRRGGCSLSFRLCALWSARSVPWHRGSRQLPFFHRVWTLQVCVPFSWEHQVINWQCLHEKVTALAMISVSSDVFREPGWGCRGLVWGDAARELVPGELPVASPGCMVFPGLALLCPVCGVWVRAEHMGASQAPVRFPLPRLALLWCCDAPVPSHWHWGGHRAFPEHLGDRNSSQP